MSGEASEHQPQVNLSQLTNHEIETPLIFPPPGSPLAHHCSPRLFINCRISHCLFAFLYHGQGQSQAGCIGFLVLCQRLPHPYVFLSLQTNTRHIQRLIDARLAFHAVKSSKELLAAAGFEQIKVCISVSWSLLSTV